MRKADIQKDVWKSFKRANREIEFLRNGGGQWVAKDRPWKNKKKYDRKRDRRIDFNCPFNFVFRVCYSSLTTV